MQNTLSRIRQIYVLLRTLYCSSIKSTVTKGRSAGTSHLNKLPIPVKLTPDSHRKLTQKLNLTQ